MSIPIIGLEVNAQYHSTTEVDWWELLGFQISEHNNSLFLLEEEEVLGWDPAQDVLCCIKLGSNFIALKRFNRFENVRFITAVDHKGVPSGYVDRLFAIYRRGRAGSIEFYDSGGNLIQVGLQTCEEKVKHRVGFPEEVREHYSVQGLRVDKQNRLLEVDNTHIFGGRVSFAGNPNVLAIPAEAQALLREGDQVYVLKLDLSDGETVWDPDSPFGEGSVRVIAVGRGREKGKYLVASRRPGVDKRTVNDTHDLKVEYTVEFDNSRPALSVDCDIG